MLWTILAAAFSFPPQQLALDNEPVADLLVEIRPATIVLRAPREEREGVEASWELASRGRRAEVRLRLRFKRAVEVGEIRLLSIEADDLRATTNWGAWASVFRPSPPLLLAKTATLGFADSIYPRGCVLFSVRTKEGSKNFALLVREVKTSVERNVRVGVGYEGGRFFLFLPPGTGGLWRWRPRMLEGGWAVEPIPEGAEVEVSLRFVAVGKRSLSFPEIEALEAMERHDIPSPPRDAKWEPLLDRPLPARPPLSFSPPRPRFENRPLDNYFGPRLFMITGPPNVEWAKLYRRMGVEAVLYWNAYEWPEPKRLVARTDYAKNVLLPADILPLPWAPIPTGKLKWAKEMFPWIDVVVDADGKRLEGRCINLAVTKLPKYRALVKWAFEEFARQFRRAVPPTRTLGVVLSGYGGETATWPVGDWKRPRFFVFDPVSLSDFRNFLRRKYGGDFERFARNVKRETGRTPKGTSFSNLLPPSDPSEAYGDFYEWYCGCVTDFIRFLVEEAKKWFDLIVVKVSGVYPRWWRLCGMWHPDIFKMLGEERRGGANVVAMYTGGPGTFWWPTPQLYVNLAHENGVPVVPESPHWWDDYVDRLDNIVHQGWDGFCQLGSHMFIGIGFEGISSPERTKGLFLLSHRFREHLEGRRALVPVAGRPIEGLRLVKVERSRDGNWLRVEGEVGGEISSRPHRIWAVALKTDGIRREVLVLRRSAPVKESPRPYGLHVAEDVFLPTLEAALSQMGVRFREVDERGFARICQEGRPAILVNPYLSSWPREVYEGRPWPENPLNRWQMAGGALVCGDVAGLTWWDEKGERSKLLDAGWSAVTGGVPAIVEPPRLIVRRLSILGEAMAAGCRSSWRPLDLERCERAGMGIVKIVSFATPQGEERFGGATLLYGGPLRKGRLLHFSCFANAGAHEAIEDALVAAQVVASGLLDAEGPGAIGVGFGFAGRDGRFSITLPCPEGFDLLTVLAHAWNPWGLEHAFARATKTKGASPTRLDRNKSLGLQSKVANSRER